MRYGGDWVGDKPGVEGGGVECGGWDWSEREIKEAEKYNEKMSETRAGE